MAFGKKEQKRECAICNNSFTELGGMLWNGKRVCSACENRLRVMYSQSTPKTDYEEAVEVAREAEREAKRKRLLTSIKNPKEIKQLLDQYVVGQDAAKEVMAVAAYNHYKRLDINHEGSKTDSEVVVEKSNILMIGPTGCGKTHIVKSLAKVLDVPFAVADANSLTEAGYVGSDVESILVSLYRNADKDIDKAAMGIVFIDEIDKLVSQRGAERMVGGKGVQQGLLKILEGTDAVLNLPGPNGAKEEFVIDTSNILFICGGAFEGLENIIADREGVEKCASFKSVKDEDLVKFGLIPEFVGRLPVLTTLNNMTADMLVKVLTEPKNALLKQYVELFKYDGIELSFEEDAIRAIAERAVARNRGARALRFEMEAVLNPYMFQLPGGNYKKVMFTREAVEGRGVPYMEEG